MNTTPLNGCMGLLPVGMYLHSVAGNEMHGTMCWRRNHCNCTRSSKYFLGMQRAAADDRLPEPGFDENLCVACVSCMVSCTVR